jgi:hypothetical protein
VVSAFGFFFLTDHIPKAADDYGPSVTGGFEEARVETLRLEAKPAQRAPRGRATPKSALGVRTRKLSNVLKGQS